MKTKKKKVAEKFVSKEDAYFVKNDDYFIIA